MCSSCIAKEHFYLSSCFIICQCSGTFAVCIIIIMLSPSPCRRPNHDLVLFDTPMLGADTITDSITYSNSIWSLISHLSTYIIRESRRVSCSNYVCIWPFLKKKLTKLFRVADDNDKVNDAYILDWYRYINQYCRWCRGILNLIEVRCKVLGLVFD